MAENSLQINSGGNTQRLLLEWEDGLPTTDELPPLSISLISPELALAFSITPEPYPTMTDIGCSDHTFLSLRKLPKEVDVDDQCKESLARIRNLKIIHDQSVPSKVDEPNRKDGAHKLRKVQDQSVLSKANEQSGEDGKPEGSENLNEEDEQVQDHSVRTLKRPRLVWSPQLHKRFVGVVEHMGIKNAVPKTVMEMMNVEGLTRENVASHLQKYRLYKKRMESNYKEMLSLTDNLFASNQIGYGAPTMSMQAFGGYGNMGMLVRGRINLGFHM